MPSSVMNRNVSRKLDSLSPPLRVQQDQEQQQTPKVDLSAVRAAKEKMATQTASKILRALIEQTNFAAEERRLVENLRLRRQRRRVDNLHLD